MKKSEQEQSQSQRINIAQAEHGIVNNVFCDYFEFTQRLGGYAIRQLQQIKKDVPILIYKGKIAKVFCHYLDTDNKTCNSSLNENEEKKCHLAIN